MTPPEPHPDAQAVLAQRAARGTPRVSALSVDGARRFFEDSSAPSADPEPVEAVRDFAIDGPAGDVPIRVYTPRGSAPFPVLVYAHGGGWMMGSLDSDDGICRALANAAECVVVSVDYRLAPEHPFPAAVEDCFTATEWVVENPVAIHGDPDRLAIGGAIAGGNLAAAVAQVARDFEGPILTHQVLLTPVTDRSFDTRPDEDTEWPVFTAADLEWVWGHYLDSDLDGRNPYASPLQAPDLSGLPPTTVLTCGFDVLGDQGVAYAERLDDAGVSVAHRHYDDMIHGFVGMLDDPELEQAHDAIADVGRGLKVAFER